MENDRFQQSLTHPPLFAGGESYSDAADEAYLNSPCNGISFLSLLAYGTYEPSAETLNPLEMPKTKPLFVVEDDVLSGEYPPYDFFSDAVPPSLSHHLPSLLSYEQQPQNSSAAAGKSPIPNPRFDKTASYMKQRSRQQPQRPSDKTRQLQKLLPWDGKVDMATVLEEAYRYIKFLQAQVSVLQSMPFESSGGSAAATNAGGGGILGKLNRQQLLQVAVNTPAVQTQLYAKGCCLYSMEQLMFLKKKSEKNALYHQMMLDSSVNPNSCLF